MRQPGRRAFVLIAALVLASCTTSDPRAVRSAKGVKTPAAPSAPSALAVPAQALESYLRNARLIDSRMSGPAAVNAGLDLGAAHDPKQLEAGVVALAAMAALQEPSFVAGVKKAGRTPAARAALAARLSRDPAAAETIAGGKRAAGRASAVLVSVSEPVVASGQAVKTASYSVQRQAWSKAKVSGPKERLMRVKRISSAGYKPVRGDADELQRAVGLNRQGAISSPVVSKGVAAAALTLLDEPKRAQALLKDANAGMCLRVAKLNYFQCLASAGPYYEDIYCLAEHAMKEPAQCVRSAATPKTTLARNAGRRG